MKYLDFNLRARDWADRQFREVTDSPVDRMREPEVVRLDPAAFAGTLRNVERGRIRRGDLIEFGEQLAGLLSPGMVREMFVASLERIGAEQRLRVRLILDDPEIANVPWEYLYLARAGGEKGLEGFIVLDPRISLVRHEPIPMVSAALATRLPLKLLVGACLAYRL